MNLRPLVKFIQGSPLNAVVKAEGLRLFVFKSALRLDGKVLSCLGLANVIADAPGKGRFSKVLPAIKDLAVEQGFDVLYLENVVNPRMPPFLSRHGFVQDPATGTDTPASFYWMTK